MLLYAPYIVFSRGQILGVKPGHGLGCVHYIVIIVHRLVGQVTLALRVERDVVTGASLALLASAVTWEPVDAPLVEVTGSSVAGMKVNIYMIVMLALVAYISTS